MKLEGRIDIAAPPPAVWDLVIQPVALSSCIPGVRELRQVDDRTFEGSVVASVGPIDGDFSFTSTIERADYPDGLEVIVRGVDSVTRSPVEARIVVALSEWSGGTQLTYRGTVDVKGRLAILGEMVLRATANLMVGHAANCLRSRLEGPTGAVM